MKTMNSKSFLLLVILPSLFCGLLPWLLPRASADLDKGDFPGWPSSWEGLPLEPDALDAREEEQVRSFPGMFARFRSGEKVIVIHWIARRTRHFHFSELCLRGGGWQMETRAREVDGDGKAWAVHLARRDGSTMKLRQRIESTRDPSVGYTDPSRWFWSFLDADDPGPPYWAVTIAEVWSGPDGR